MTTNLVIAAGILERLRYLFSEADPESQRMAAIKNALHPVCEQFKQIIKYADANDNVADLMAKRFGVTSRLYLVEDHMEMYVLQYWLRRNGLKNGIPQGSTLKIKEIKKLFKELTSVVNQASSPTFIFGTQFDQGNEDSSAGKDGGTKPLEIFGMEGAKKELMSALTKETKHLNLVSVCGMPGIGKTTLAQRTYEDPEIASLFHFRALIPVSQEYERKNILQKIHSQIGLGWKKSENMTEDNLAEDIYKRLKTNRYLIVLDDIWESDVWFSLRMVFPDNEMGSCILITTQLKDVASQVSPSESHIHIMRPLADEESWKLLRHILSAEEKIGAFGEQIISASGGLPLAIVGLAYSVREDQKDWKEHLEHLYQTSPSSKILDLSYKNLQIQLRACLLHLGNYFLEDTEIGVDTACQLLIAEGLVSIEDKRSGETLMDVAKSYLEELDNRSLIQILDEDFPQKRGFKSCRIHKVIRGFCKQRGKEEKTFETIDLGGKNQTTILPRRLAIYLNEYECSYDFLNENADYFRSISFLNSSRSAQGYKRPREIPRLDNFTRLRVLYLYAVDLGSGALPSGMDNLVYLRFLSLKECYLEKLCSSISKIFYLQTLDLRVRNECQIVIPDVFNCLTRLRHLYLPLVYRLPSVNRTPDDQKLHLGGLEELELLHNFNTSLCDVADLKKLTNLIWLSVTAMGAAIPDIEAVLDFLSKNLSQLRSTSIDLRDFDCYSRERLCVLENVFNSIALRSLRVEGYFKELPNIEWTSSKLTELVLNGSELVDDPMQILGKVPKLRILVLEFEAYNGTEMKCSSFRFPKLRYLKLSKLYNLKTWVVEKEAMPNLCTLIIENCSNLETLPEGLQFTAKLRKLEIASMSDAFVCKIRKANETEGEDFYKIRHVQPNVKLNGNLLVIKEAQQGLTAEEEETEEFFKPVQVDGHSHYPNYKDQGGEHFWDQDYLS